uniref:Microbial-type PARG catalytic domain-containing protein n=1 Tax=Alexandrium monilatum TaxID=311494 RepID=A0A7S4UG93_9DINO
MKRAAPWNAPWYEADDVEAPPCCQCGALQGLRWATGGEWFYCLGCWRDYGSQAAEVIHLCGQEPTLQRARYAAPRLFSEPPARGGPRHLDSLPIEVTPEDSFDAARRLLQDPRRREPDLEAPPPVVLNMANATWVGGGFLRDSSGQEEELCRRSNVFPQLMEAARAGSFPIPELGSIVLQDVTVFRERVGEEYTRLDAPYHVSVITAAAPCHPDLSTDAARHEYAELMQAKVDSLLSVIEHLGYTELVLSAWGCGAFRNPPKEVARIFREALHGKFAGAFRRIVFAVYDRPDWRETNYSIFKGELCG